MLSRAAICLLLAGAAFYSAKAQTVSRDVFDHNLKAAEAESLLRLVIQADIAETYCSKTGLGATARAIQARHGVTSEQVGWVRADQFRALEQRDREQLGSTEYCRRVTALVAVRQ